MTSLALVVADTGTPFDTAEHALDAASGQLDPADCIAWVSEREPPAVEKTPIWCAAPSGASRGDLYGVGLRWATTTNCDVVAFTDSATKLEPEWRVALDDAMSRGAVVVGGPVRPGAREGFPRTTASWAGFLAEYAVHAVPPYVSETGDLSANNVGYRLAAIGGAHEGPFWKSVVDRELSAEGHALELVPDMTTTSLRSYCYRDLTIGRMAAGRLYGAQAGGASSLAHRLIRVAACAALPFVRLARIARTVRHDRPLASVFWRSLLLLVVAETAWSLGEAVGYLAPSRPPTGVR